MKGKVEAGMEFRYWSENVNISKFAASGCQLLPSPRSEQACPWQHLSLLIWKPRQAGMEGVFQG